MTPDLYLQALILSLEIINKVIDDMPKEDRAQAWHNWFTFWERVGRLVKVVKDE